MLNNICVAFEHSTFFFTFPRTTPSKREVHDSNTFVPESFSITVNDNDIIFPSLLWFPKLYKDPFRHRFMSLFAELIKILLLLRKLIVNCLLREWRESNMNFGEF